MNGFKWRGLLSLPLLLIGAPLPAQAGIQAPMFLCERFKNAVEGTDPATDTLRFLADQLQRPPERWTADDWIDVDRFIRTCGGYSWEARDGKRTNFREQALKEVEAYQKARSAAAEQKVIDVKLPLMLPGKDAVPASGLSCPDLFRATLSDVQAIGFFEQKFSLPTTRWTEAQWRSAFTGVHFCRRADLPEDVNGYAGRARYQLIERHMALDGQPPTMTKAVIWAVDQAYVKADQEKLLAERGQNNARLIEDFAVFKQSFRPQWLEHCYAAIKAGLDDPRSFKADPYYNLIDPATGGGTLTMLQLDMMKLFQVNLQPPNERPFFVLVRFRAKNRYGAYQLDQRECVYYVDKGQVYFHRVV